MWLPGALCHDYDPELWFALRMGSRQAEQACAICARCPVAAQCLAYALDRPELEGIWAGTSRHGRQLIRKQTEEDDWDLIMLAGDNEGAIA